MWGVEINLPKQAKMKEQAKEHGIQEKRTQQAKQTPRMSQDDSFEAGLDREQTRIKAGRTTAIEGMTTGINGTTKFI